MVGAVTKLNKRYILLQNWQKRQTEIEPGIKKTGGTEYGQTSYTLTGNKHEYYLVLG